MKDRANLTDALQGGAWQPCRIVRASGKSGIFITSPVYDDGVPVRTIVAKIGIARLAEQTCAAARVSGLSRIRIESV